MGNGQTFSGLDQRQHELTLHQAGLGASIGANIILQVRLTGHLYGGEVVKHHGEVLINQGAHEGGQSVA